MFSVLEPPIINGWHAESQRGGARGRACCRARSLQQEAKLDAHITAAGQAHRVRRRRMPSSPLGSSPEAELARRGTHNWPASSSRAQLATAPIIADLQLCWCGSAGDADAYRRWRDSIPRVAWAPLGRGLANLSARVDFRLSGRPIGESCTSNHYINQLRARSVSHSWPRTVQNISTSNHYMNQLRARSVSHSWPGTAQNISSPIQNIKWFQIWNSSKPRNERVLKACSFHLDSTRNHSRWSKIV